MAPPPTSEIRGAGPGCSYTNPAEPALFAENVCGGLADTQRSNWPSRSRGGSDDEAACVIRRGQERLRAEARHSGVAPCPTTRFAPSTGPVGRIAPATKSIGYRRRSRSRNIDVAVVVHDDGRVGHRRRRTETDGVEPRSAATSVSGGLLWPRVVEAAISRAESAWDLRLSLQHGNSGQAD